MEDLRQKLEKLLDSLENADQVRANLIRQKSFYPFNEFEHRICHLIASGKLSIQLYEELRNDYIQRNKYLDLFEISAPRSFGEKWAQQHLQELVQTLQKPSKKYDLDYKGQYDFILTPSIRVEVKASRAVGFNEDAPLYIKALSSDSPKPFDMNFQQVKPGCCDVFVWIAVWKDLIKYWVISSYEVENSQFYSKGQHRGNKGEGQLHIKQDNISRFDQYSVQPGDIEEAIRLANNNEKKFREVN